MDKRCLFCGGIASTKDHIPSKNLLERPYPVNLLTVACCLKCNRSFSLDEEYFLNVLVETSISPILLSKKLTGGTVYRARERAPKLKDLINRSLIKSEDGKTYLQIDIDRIKKVIEKNAMGLFYHKYKICSRLTEFKCVDIFPYSLQDLRPADSFLLAYKSNFSPKKWNTVQSGVFSYIIVKDWRRNNKLSMIFDIHNSFWCIINIPFSTYHRKRKRYRLADQLMLFN